MDGGVAINGECLSWSRVSLVKILRRSVGFVVAHPFSATSAASASTPNDVVWFDLFEDGLCLGFGLDVLNAADENVELALQALAELLDGGDLLFGADDASDRPGLL